MPTRTNKLTGGNTNPKHAFQRAISAIYQKYSFLNIILFFYPVIPLWAVYSEEIIIGNQRCVQMNIHNSYFNNYKLQIAKMINLIVLYNWDWPHLYEALIKFVPLIIFSNDHEWKKEI